MASMGAIVSLSKILLLVNETFQAQKENNRGYRLYCFDLGSIFEALVQGWPAVLAHRTFEDLFALCLAVTSHFHRDAAFYWHVKKENKSIKYIMLQHLRTQSLVTSKN